MFLKRSKSIVILLFFIVLFSILTPVEISANKKREIPKMEFNTSGGLKIENDWMSQGGDKNKTAFNIIMKEYRHIITGVSGIAALTMIAIFIINLMKLASASTNPSERSRAISALMWSGIATTGLGSVTLITGLFYNTL